MTTPPLTGPEAIELALSRIDIDVLEKEQRDVIASKKKTARPRAVRILGVLAGLRKNKVTPAELMLRSVPVIPPKFRPFSVTGDTFLPGDANEMYRDLVEYRRLYQKTEESLGREGSGEVYGDLVKAVNATYGFGDSPNPKTRARAVKGFFQTVTGASPKTGWLQQKMLSKPVDTVARGVIIPDADYDMNEVGLPREQAWKLFGSYVQRRLVRGGMSPPAALRQVKDRSPEALKALEAELVERPVVLTRSPAWHRFNLAGSNARLVDGDAIRVNTWISTGMNADYDGNCVVGSTHIQLRVDEELIHIVEGLHADNVKTTSDGRHVMLVTQSVKILTRGTDGTVLELPIREFPHITFNPKKDKNGALVYDVPPGVKVVTATPDGKGSRWSEATHFTVEDGCELVTLTTTSGRSVGISANESVAVPDLLGGLMKVTPAAAVGQLVPVLHKLPTLGDTRDAGFGWMLGAFLSDGWVSDGYVGYAKADSRLRQRFLREFCRASGCDENAVRRYETYHEADTNCGIGGISSKLHFSEVAVSSVMMAYLRNECYTEQTGEGRPCLRKKLPGDVWTFSRPALLGLLSGLLDGDGSVSVNRSKRRPQVLANFSSSAPELRDGVRYVLRLLGIRSGYSTVKPKKGRRQRVDNYVITISTVDLAKVVGELTLTTQYEGIDILRREGVSKDDRDIVPVPKEFVRRIVAQRPAGVSVGSLTSIIHKWRALPYVAMTRAVAVKLLAVYTGERDVAWRATRDYVQEVDMHWEVVTGAVPRPTERVYDIVVPETKVYAIANGLVVYDTMSVHVPSSPEAVQDVKERMMPDKMLWSIRDRDSVTPQPKHEQIIGLNLSNLPSKNKHKFTTDSDAMRAIESGQVDLNDDIEIDAGYVPPSPSPAL